MSYKDLMCKGCIFEIVDMDSHCRNRSIELDVIINSKRKYDLNM